jgi:hypothetical protein
MRQFSDRYGIPEEKLSMTITLDSPREYGHFVRAIQHELPNNYLFAGYTDYLSDRHAWYEKFILYGVEINITYKGKQ